MDLPVVVDRLCDELIACRGVERVVLGGSRGAGTASPDSDWDIGVHYRGDADFDPIRSRGELHPPGSWGSIMNGGAWLLLDGLKVDVLLRDLAVVEHWTAAAEVGTYEVLHLLGYLAGVPTYSLTAELAIAVVLRGDDIRHPEMSDALAATGSRRWRLHRDFSLDYAGALDARGDTAASVAHLVKACLEEAHARRCEARRWVLNEKGLLATAGLDAVAHAASRGALDEVRAGLGA